MMLKTIGAGFCALSLGMNNPAGHQMLHDIGLRVVFSDAVALANEMSGREVSFEEFKTFAPFYLQEYYGDDQESWKSAMDLLSLSLCLPRPNDSEQPNIPEQNYIMACHAFARNEEDEGDELKPEPDSA